MDTQNLRNYFTICENHFTCFFSQASYLLLFSCSTMSDSSQLHELQHARFHCPSLSARVCSNSCLLSQRWHLTNLSSHPPLLPPSIFPSIWVFVPMSWLFASGGQSTGASASAPVLPMNIQGRFPLGLTGLISLLSKGLSRIFSITTTVWKHQFFSTRSSLPSSSEICTWLLEKS